METTEASHYGFSYKLVCSGSMWIDEQIMRRKRFVEQRLLLVYGGVRGCWVRARNGGIVMWIASQKQISFRRSGIELHKSRIKSDMTFQTEVALQIIRPVTHLRPHMKVAQMWIWKIKSHVICAVHTVRRKTDLSHIWTKTFDWIWASLNIAYVGRDCIFSSILWRISTFLDIMNVLWALISGGKIISLK